MPLSVKGKYRVEIVRSRPDMGMQRQSQKKGKQTEESFYGCVLLKAQDQKEAKNYICVDQQESFQVKVISTNMNDADTYGAVLFLDGQRVHGKKTFRRVTNFPGYKKGNGNYEEFVFSVPDFQDERHFQPKPHQEESKYGKFGKNDQNRKNNEIELQLESKHQGKRGTIIVEFYRTEEFERRSIPNRIHSKKYETATTTDVQKKNFADSLFIKPGRSFCLGNRGPSAPGQAQLSPPPYQDNYSDSFNSNSQGYNERSNRSYDNRMDDFQRRRDQKFQDKRNGGFDRFDRNSGGRNRFQGQKGGGMNDRRSFKGGRNDRDPRFNQDQQGEMTIDHKVLYSELVDSCEIHYSNWAHLQFNKLIDIKKYEHLKLTPQCLMTSADFVTKVLWTVINYRGRLHHSKADSEFQKATGYRISDFFEFKEGEIALFMKKKPGMFQVDDQGYAKAIQYDERKEFHLSYSVQAIMHETNIHIQSRLIINV